MPIGNLGDEAHSRLYEALALGTLAAKDVASVSQGHQHGVDRLFLDFLKRDIVRQRATAWCDEGTTIRRAQVCVSPGPFRALLGPPGLLRARLGTSGPS